VIFSQADFGAFAIGIETPSERRRSARYALAAYVVCIR
jgi:hypothetical protein